MVHSDVLHPHPPDATLTVTRAARVLGVHPNTVRAWSDAGRIRYYRINPRGDRRYRIGDLNRYLSVAEAGPALAAGPTSRAAEGPTSRAAPVRRQGADVQPVAKTVLHADGSAPGAPGAARGDDFMTGSPSSADDAARAAVSVLSGLGRVAGSIAGSAFEAEALLGSATRIIREGAGFRHVSIWRRTGERLEPVGISGLNGTRITPTDLRSSWLGDVLARPGLVTEAPGGAADETSTKGLNGRRLASAISAADPRWGVLLVEMADTDDPSDTTRLLVAGAADIVGTIVRGAAAAAGLDRRLHWAEALGRVANDIGSRSDPDELFGRLVDHALTMFDADRAAVFLFNDDGSRRTVAARGLSAAYLAAMRPGDLGTLTSAALESGQPVFAVGYRDDQRGTSVRASVVQEGYDTVCVAPLTDEALGPGIGSLNVYHDSRHPWSDDEMAALIQLASQASAAIRSARTYAQLATWAAQLQSIQQLGARLSRLSDVAAIGSAIATELRELIDYHNVRVYRQYGDDLIPVAMLGQVGEYVDETPDQLRVKVGEGITGWVAAHRVAENLPDAAADPRANTIPGTDGNIDESMLLAPMVFEDEVLGVVVLSKLGLNQFTGDDFRLLVIYASFAAQAMAHADATERLERQLKSRRDLLRITESMLGTLDTSAVLGSAAERLGDLVGSDNIWIELLDEAGKALVPVIAQGVNAVAYLHPLLGDQSSLGTWVVEHNEPVLVGDQFHDQRVFTGETGPVHGGLICVPLRGRTGALGILTIERLGEGRSFTTDEFELVQLFAAQVSIALQNARAHGAITRQAATDDLTGLRNHRSFDHDLGAAIANGSPFSLLMVDLDRFKSINDTFGHEAGNRLLQEVARAITTASRDTDAVFRYGGDEFVLILSGTDADHVGPVAERIRRAVVGISGPTSDMRLDVHLDASAGVATFPSDGTSAEEILLAADRACFKAKRDGGGRVATAEEGLELVDRFTLQVPTPIDSVS